MRVLSNTVKESLVHSENVFTQKAPSIVFLAKLSLQKMRMLMCVD